MSKKIRGPGAIGKLQLRNGMVVVTDQLHGCARINRKIEQQYLQNAGNEDVVRSHFFADRYENIYLSVKKVPDLARVLTRIEECATILLKPAAGKFRIGYWFNAMEIGDVTQLHNHDEDDELLSGVYYVRVPDRSGDLVIMNGDEKLMILPKEGMLVFFPTHVMHEVLENRGTGARLSIGFNVGRSTAG